MALKRRGQRVRLRTHPVTPMAEIRRHKGMLFDEFTRKYPDWEWSERRSASG